MTERAYRSAQEVLDGHLHLSKTGTIEEGLSRNYAEHLVVLCTRGIFRSHDGLRQVNQFLREDPRATFGYHTVLVEGKLGFLEWTARAEDGRVATGADSYLIREGHIVARTVYYTIKAA